MTPSAVSAHPSIPPPFAAHTTTEACCPVEVSVDDNSKAQVSGPPSEYRPDGHSSFWDDLLGPAQAKTYEKEPF